MQEKSNNVSKNDGRILVCLSSSPSNQKVIEAAAEMAEGSDDVIMITMRQINILLNRYVIVFPLTQDKELGDAIELDSPKYTGKTPEPDENESEIAKWVFAEKTVAGTHTDNFKKAKSIYYPICINEYCYGVIAVYLNGKTPDPFEHSVLTSIIGECALALESLRNAAEKEEAAIAVRNEQLRSNLLRSISHDIRTPLTTISGNASNLLTHYEHLDTDTLKQIFTDIYDDAEWLINLVENLLSISRIENGKMDLHLSLEVVNDVIEEALRHIDKNADKHKIVVDLSEDVLLARMDARLITQVVINLINNAIKNTQPGSEIKISSEHINPYVYVHVEDNGPGIPNAMKPHIFEDVFQ